MGVADHEKKGRDWTSILLQLAPLIGAGVGAAAGGGPGAMLGFRTGSGIRTGELDRRERKDQYAAAAALRMLQREDENRRFKEGQEGYDRRSQEQIAAGNARSAATNASREKVAADRIKAGQKAPEPGLILDSATRSLTEEPAIESALTDALGPAKMAPGKLRYSPSNRQAAIQEQQRLQDENKPKPPKTLSAEDDLVVSALTAKLGRPPTDSETLAGIEEHSRKRAPTMDPALYASLIRSREVGADDLPPNVSKRVDQTKLQFDNEPIVRRYNMIMDGAMYAQSIEPKSKNVADHIGLIYAFAKAMDPESVVREGEYATVKKYAQSWLQDFGFDALRVVSNQGMLAPDAVARMQQTIALRADPLRKQYKQLRGSYAANINKITGRKDGADYLPDYEVKDPGAQAQAAAGGRETKTVMIGGQAVTYVKGPDGQWHKQ